MSGAAVRVICVIGIALTELTDRVEPHTTFCATQVVSLSEGPQRSCSKNFARTGAAYRKSPASGCFAGIAAIAATGPSISRCRATLASMYAACRAEIKKKVYPTCFVYDVS